MSVVYRPWEGEAEPTTLADCVKKELDLWAFCRACGHATRVGTKSLVLKVGFLSLRDAARRMRCVSCHGRRCALMADRKWPTR